MAKLRDFAIQYAWQVGVVMLYYSTRALIKHWPKQPRKQGNAVVKKDDKGATFKASWIDPQTYQANNPRWLKEAQQQDPEPDSLSCDACPHLIQFTALIASGAALPDFGSDVRKKWFCLDPDAVYLNHGSYGAALRLATDVQNWYQQQLESQPVRFMETTAVSGMMQAAAQVARFVGAQPSDIVPVSNATTAVNAVLHSIQLQTQDVIIIFNTTYPAVRSAVARVAAANADVRILEVQLTMEGLETEPTQYTLQALQKALEVVPKGKLKFAILDHVTSFPPTIMPVAEMTQLCRQAGARVLVDGAHAVGSLPGLDVPSIGADYYTSNLHKWCCTPKGSAFLWVHPSHQHKVLPLVTSHGQGLGFKGEWLWQGTCEPCAWLAVPAALTVLKAVGLGKIADYNNRLVKEAAGLLAGRWQDHHCHVVGGDGAGNTAGMLAVSLPPLRGYQPVTGDSAAALHDWLRNSHSIEVPVIPLNGVMWLRFSAQMYNKIQDYQKLVDSLDPLVETSV